MPWAYVKDFSGGVNERNPAQIDPTEIQESLNVVSRGGVFRHAPVWKQLTAPIPAGKYVLCGVARQDGTSVIILWSEANQYEYGILSVDGSTLQGPNPETIERGDFTTATPWPAPAGTDPFPLVRMTDWDNAGGTVQGVFTPSGTVFVNSTQGYWPYVVANYNDGKQLTRQRRLRFNDYLYTYEQPNRLYPITLYDIRYRQPADYRIGITDEDDLFKQTPADSAAFSNWDNNVDDGAAPMTTTRQYITISTRLSFNVIDMRFRAALPADFDAKIWFVDINGEAGSLSDTSAVAVELQRYNDFRIAFVLDWLPQYAQTSLKNYAGIDDRKVGTGQIRAIIRLDNIPAEGVQLTNVDIQHNQYFRLVTDNISPHLVTTHRGRLLFAFDNVIQFGTATRGAMLRNWTPAGKQEYFTEGGTRITAMHSHKNFLAVFLDSSINAITGNSKDDWGVDKLIDFSGTDNPASTVSDVGYLGYEDTEGNLSMLLHEDNVRQVTRHCKSFLDAAKGNGTAAFHILQNDSLVLVYRNAGNASNGQAFIVDPETLREDKGGGWQVSVFPFDGPGARDDQGALLETQPDISASWSSIKRIPMVAAGNHFYKCEIDPTEDDLRNRPVRYRIPLHPGGDPTAYSVKYVIVNLDLDNMQDVDINFEKWKQGQALTPSLSYDSTRLQRIAGAVRINVPDSLGLIAVDINCGGPRILNTIMFEYDSEFPGSVLRQAN